MNGRNLLILVGFVGKDPEVTNLDSGTKVAKFSFVTSLKYKNKAGEYVEESQWHLIICWRGLAEVAEKYVKKGSKLYIEGKVTYRSWNDKEGHKRYSTEIVADNFIMLDGKPQREKQSEQPQQTKGDKQETLDEKIDRQPDKTAEEVQQQYVTDRPVVTQPELKQEEQDDLPF